jgi:hypothetical protein
MSQNPYSSGPADPRPAARPGAASQFIPDNLRAENRLPTQADSAARSEFERAARSGTLRATDHYTAQASRSNIGIFINQKDD